MAKGKTLRFAGGRGIAFVGAATHFGVCVNWQTTPGRWERTDAFPLSRWVPESRQLDMYVPFLFFGVKWESRGGMWA